MKTTVRDGEPFEKVMTVTVEDSLLEEAKTKAARRLSNDLKIKGFRPGKAPRPIVESMVGAERLKSEAIEDLLPSVVGDALAESELAPAVTPSVEQVRDIEDGVELDVKVTLWPTIERLPSYKDREITTMGLAVTAEEIQLQVDRLRDQFAELDGVERPAQEGDFVLLNLSAQQNGEPVDEAKAEDLLYEVGSGSFIDGLDSALPGRSAGEFSDFEGTLPQGFGDKAGEVVSFKVLVKQVKEKTLPDLTDEWTAETTEFETVAELRSALEDEMAEAKAGGAASEYRSHLIEELVGELDVTIPDAIEKSQMDSILHRFAHQLSDQGIELADYFRVTGVDQETFVEDLRKQAQHNIRTQILLDAVVEAEGISLEEGELAEAIAQIAQSAEDPDDFRIRFAASAEAVNLAGDILRRKALDALADAARPVNEDGTPIEFAQDEDTTDEDDNDEE